MFPDKRESQSEDKGNLVSAVMKVEYGILYYLPSRWYLTYSISGFFPNVNTSLISFRCLDATRKTMTTTPGRVQVCVTENIGGKHSGNLGVAVIDDVEYFY